MPARASRAVNRCSCALWLVASIQNGGAAAAEKSLPPLSSLPPAAIAVNDLEIAWYTFDGGGGASSDANFVIEGTIGQPDAGGVQSSSTHDVEGGFWVASAVGDPVVGVPGGIAVTPFAFAPLTPNPTHGAAIVSWSLPTPSHVDITAFDALGRVAVVLANGDYESGVHSIEWSAGQGAGRLSPGIYLVRLRTPARTIVRRVVILR